MLQKMTNRIGSFFSTGYDAIKTTGKRKAASAVLKTEDEQLKGRDRKQMIGTGRELARNYSMVQWAIRKHLDYVTQYDFQMKTDNDELNERVETLMMEWMRPTSCDTAGRHPFPRLLRMLEARRVLDGDCFLLKRRNGTLQTIEGDLIQDPDRADQGERWFNGCHVNASGRTIAWGLHKRESYGQTKFVRRVKAQNMIQHACFERFDQCRGISPLAAAYNSFRDCYEGVDHQLALMKAQSLFAMVVTSGAEDGMGEITKTGDGYDVDFGKGPLKLEMDPGDDAKFLKTDSPGDSTQSFLNLVLGMAIKSLDLPYNFLDEGHTNFFGSRAAWLLYDRSCHAKRADVLEVLRQVTVWLLRIWITNGTIRLPAGTTINDVPFVWIHRGMPWWDPSKEITGDLLAISAGLDNPIRLCAARGNGDFETNIKQIAKAMAIAKENEVPVSFAMGESVPAQADAEEEDEDSEESSEESENDSNPTNEDDE